MALTPSGPSTALLQRTPHPPPPPPTKKLAKCGLAKFGQTKLAKFGQIRLAKCGQLSLAKCGSGQIQFGQMRPNKDGQMRSRPPPKGGPRRVGSQTQKKWGPEGWGPRRVGSPKFCAFLSLSRPIFALFVFLWGSARGILVVFEAREESNVHVWSSRVVRVKPRRSRRGFTRQTEKFKREHLRVPVFTNTTKIQRKRPTREGEKNKKCGGRGKKERNFGRSWGGRVLVNAGAGAVRGGGTQAKIEAKYFSQRV